MTVQKFRPEWDSTVGVNWQDQAACKDNPAAEYAFMYSGAKVRNQYIKTFCHEVCPVVEECGTFGTESMSEGVWGGIHRTMAQAQKLNTRSSAIRGHEHEQVRIIATKMYRAGQSLRNIARELHKSERMVLKLVEESGMAIRGRKNGS